MKLASHNDGSRDGQLLVVSRDLGTAHFATGIAHRLQQVLDDWNFMAPQLQDLYDELNRGKARHAFAFDPAQCMAPLPRAGQCVLAQAWPDRPALAGVAAGDAPTLQHGAGDDFLGAGDALAPWLPPTDDVAAADAHALDLGAGLAAITGDVPRGATAEQGLEAVRLLTLANVLTLNAPGHDAFARQTAVALGPVAITPDELGPAWAQGRVALPLRVHVNDRALGLCDAAAGMRWGFGELLAQAARTRRLRAGCVLGAGVVGQAGAPQGCASLADKRAAEQQQHGAASTPWLRAGDRVRIEMKDREGGPLFGALDNGLTLKSD